MVRQFLRRMFAGRKSKEEYDTTPEHAEEDWTEMPSEEERIEIIDSLSDASLEVERHKESRDEPRMYVITRDKIEHHSYKQIMHLVEETLEQIELGLRHEGRLQLRLSPELSAETDEFFGKRIGKYIEGAERETYDATAFMDWTDEETARIYRNYVLPAQPEKHRTFVQSRMVMIYDTCEAFNWDARQVARRFAEAIGWEVEEKDFIRFEQWLNTMSQHIEEEETPPEEGEFSHITPIQVSREEVEQEDITKLAAFFDEILSNPEQIRSKKESLVFSFYGFSGELEDVMQDDGVNTWASRLVEQYPYVFYFLNDEYVPMTQFVTSMVVTSRVEGDEVVYDDEELTEFIDFIRGALIRLAEWTGENPGEIVEEFEHRLFRA